MGKGNRRTIRRRIIVIAITTVMCAATGSTLLWGLLSLNRAANRLNVLNRRQMRILRYIGRTKHEITLLETSHPASSQNRLEGTIEETGEVLNIFFGTFEGSLEEHPQLARLQEEWQEIKSAVSLAKSTRGDVSESIQGKWAAIDPDLFALEEGIYKVCEDLSETLMLQRRDALWICSLGTGLAFLGFLTSLWTVASIVSDIASDSYDPHNLEEEVRQIIQEEEFQSRMRFLSDDDRSTEGTKEWTLEQINHISERRTHLCFEVAVSADGETVWLWGRRYKWAGYLKSFQRVFFPAFAEATWQALCIMHNNGLQTPVPVAKKRLRAGPFKAGWLVIMEHVGEVSSVQTFLRSDFCLLDKERQNEFIRHLLNFIESLHELGIYGVKPRYLHGKYLLADDTAVELYLFDLDKVLLWESCPKIFDNLLRRKDQKRILSQLKPVLDAQQLERVKGWT
ncbi:MAG: lipopolysaccharide kinase InaA family protein [Planctomycetota bacterium]